MQKRLLCVFLVLGLSVVQAQQFYLGAGGAPTTWADAETPFLHLQAGVIQDGLEMRLGFTTNLAFGGAYASYAGADLLGTFPLFEGAARGYAGGGLGFSSAFARSTLALEAVLGGEYRTGPVALFADIGALVFLPFPFPQARAGVNIYF